MGDFFILSVYILHLLNYRYYKKKTILILIFLFIIFMSVRWAVENYKGCSKKCYFTSQTGFYIMHRLLYNATNLSHPLWVTLHIRNL